jgi:DNA-binding LacI/PurR family transcriptional regulator
MANETAVVSNLSLVARRLEGDIRSRSLQAGDRYLSIADASELLGVSPATAHRAMDLLVEKGLLVRQHGRGTFVGEAVGRSASKRVRSVFILMPEETEGFAPFPMFDALVSAIRRRLVGVNVQVCFVPTFRPMEYLAELVGGAHVAGQLAGVIPISCSREIYKFLHQTGVPMVVLGSLFPDQQHIASIDADYRQVGILLARHLVDHGHKRMGLLVMSEGRPGDHAFLDGISDTLTDAGLPHNALAVRIFPRNVDAFRALVRELLQQPDRITGIICGTSRLVAGVLNVAQELGLSVPNDLDVVFHGQPSNAAEDVLTHVETKVPFIEVAEALADRLAQVSEGKPLTENHLVIPVCLHNGVNGRRKN